LLAGHALGETRTRAADVWQLQSDVALQGAIHALGQPHRAHAADAELAQ